MIGLHIGIWNANGLPHKVVDLEQVLHRHSMDLMPYLQCAIVLFPIDLGNVNITACYWSPNHSISANDYNCLFGQLGADFLIGGDWNTKHRL
ncbi:hypothetical protein ACLKA6_019107 [Drosophila palustris]